MTKNRVALICIGNELLSGRTLNTNMSFLGYELAKMGLPLKYSVTTRDYEDSIRAALDYCLSNFEIIITTGGLGPTSDDITKRCIASCLGKKLLFDEHIWQAITNRFARRGIKVPEINRGQAEIPEDFVPLENLLGTAPGLFYEEKGVLLFLIPGVPLEMKSLFIEQVKPILAEHFSCSSIVVRTIHTIDIPESKLVELINDIDIPEGCELAYLPQLGRVDLRISGTNAGSINKLFAQIESRSKPYIWGYDEESLPGLIYHLFKGKKLSLSLAESCTGGLVQVLLTDIPGASEFFQGGIVTYSNQAKRDLLGISEEQLNKYGAVSPEIAKMMAEGVRSKFRSDVAASITGIAGPKGGTEDKPVGTVCFAVSSQAGTETWKRIFPGNRQAIRDNSAMFLLNLIRQTILYEGNR